MMLTQSGMQYFYLTLLQSPMHLHKKSCDRQQQWPPNTPSKKETKLCSSNSKRQQTNELKDDEQSHTDNKQTSTPL